MTTFAWLGRWLPSLPLPTPPAGAARRDITVVEYFDNACPVCRHLEPELRKLLASNVKVRIIRKDWPVFGEASEYAAYCSYAAAREGRNSPTRRPDPRPRLL